MAPEQVTGDEVGFRTDLFAAGAILFEMVAGQPAFAGKTVVEVLYATLHEQPPALSGAPAIAAVDRVIRRALAKAPKDRYPTAEAMAADLRATLLADGTGAAARARALTRLVVLPFRALRPDPDTDFLAFSLPDAISTSLSGLPSLVVRSSATAARFATGPADLKTIAAEADVDRVLTGTLLRSGDQLRVSTQLVEAPGGTLVCSHTAQGAVGDLFALQDDMSRRIVEALALPLAGSPSATRRDVPRSARAYEFYLRANEIGRGYEHLTVARDLYLRCLEEDPHFAPAWARLGRCHRVIGKFFEAGPRTGAAPSRLQARPRAEPRPRGGPQALRAPGGRSGARSRGHDPAPAPRHHEPQRPRALRRPRPCLPLLRPPRRLARRPPRGAAPRPHRGDERPLHLVGPGRRWRGSSRRRRTRTDFELRTMAFEAPRTAGGGPRGRLKRDRADPRPPVFATVAAGPGALLDGRARGGARRSPSSPPRHGDPEALFMYGSLPGARRRRGRARSPRSARAVAGGFAVPAGARDHPWLGRPLRGGRPLASRAEPAAEAAAARGRSGPSATPAGPDRWGRRGGLRARGGSPARGAVPAAPFSGPRRLPHSPGSGRPGCISLTARAPSPFLARARLAACLAGRAGPSRSSTSIRAVREQRHERPDTRRRRRRRQRPDHADRQRELRHHPVPLPHDRRAARCPRG